MVKEDKSKPECFIATLFVHMYACIYGIVSKEQGNNKGYHTTASTAVGAEEKNKQILTYIV